MKDGLVAYYPFNGKANDESGNANNGTVHGPTLTGDRFGNSNSAYSFDGDGDYIEVSDNDTLDITGPITIMAWIKPTDLSGFNKYVVCKRDDSPPGGNVYDLDIYPNKVRSLFHFQGGGAQTRRATGETSIIENKWQHIAVTWDRDTTVTVYYNGQPDGTGPFDVNADGPIKTSEGRLEIGWYSGGGTATYFKGIIDDVHIYNRALSPDEIIAISGVSQTYEFVTKWGSYGTGDGQFNLPNGIAVNSSDNVYVADRDNHRVQKFKKIG